jgi:hypothetical protein
MRTLTITAVGAVAMAAVAVAILAPSRSANARGPSDRVALKLVAVEQDCGGADLPPRDGSPGDIQMCRGRLQQRASGAPAGTAAWFCPYIGTEKAGSLCTAVASLRDGDLLLAGRLSHVSARSTWAITGSTGRYGNARGTASQKAVKTAPAPSAVPTGGPPTTRSTRFRGAAVDVGSGTTQPPGPSHVPPLASSD